MALAEEIWGNHPNFPYHEFSTWGRVAVAKRISQFSALEGTILKGYMTPKGYIQARLKDKDGNTKLHFVHRIILEVFVGPCPEGHQGAHKDGTAWNNSLDNLRWATPIENQADRVLHGTSNQGEQNPMYKHGFYVGSKA